MSASLLTPAAALAALRNLSAGSRDAEKPEQGQIRPAEAAPSLATSLSDAAAPGMGTLVRPEFDVAAMRARALQAQKLLGAQAVSIANQHSQLVLKLFGG